MTKPAASVLKEAARLLGAALTADFERDLCAAYETLAGILKPRSVYKIVPVTQTATGVLLGETEIKSRDLQKLFARSKCAVLLAATLGADVDALIRRKMATDMHTATLLDACASAEIERVCDNLEQEIAASLGEGCYLTRRFSPGYGDVDIKYSSGLVYTLNTQKYIGLSLTQAGMLVPTKSVTAMLGVSDTPQNRFRRCDECAANENCIYKKRGERCGI